MLFFVAMFSILMPGFKWPTYLQAIAFFSLSVVLELFQYYSFKRSVDGMDILYNFTGILLVLMKSDVKLMQKETYLKEGGFRTLNYYE